MKYESVVPFGLLSCALAKWQPLDEASLRKAFKTNDHTLAAYILADDKSLGAFEEEWESVVSSAKEGCIDKTAIQNVTEDLGKKKSKSPRATKSAPDIKTLTLASSITAFSQRMSRPAVSYIDAKNATSFTAIDDVVVVAYLEQDNSGLRERFTKAAEQYRDRYSFAIRHRKGHGVSLECQNNVNVEQLSITDLSDALAIENFVKRCAQPLIPEFTRRNELEYSKLGKSIVHYFTSSDEDRESYISAIRPLAKRYQEYLLFVTTDMNEYPQMLSMTGHKSGASNVVSVVNPLNGAVFPYRGKDITADTIEKFLGDVSSGKVKAWDGVHVDEGIKHEEL